MTDDRQTKLLKTCSQTIPRPSLTITGHSELFAVRRIYCVGRNYRDHAREMGMSDREPPFFFCKSLESLLPAAGNQAISLPMPSHTHNLHYETELVVALAAGGRDLVTDQVDQLIAGYALGFDLTKRDLQTELKNDGKPWEIAKAFDQAAPISPLSLHNDVLTTGRLQAWKNGQLVQNADIADMIWSIREIIVELSRYFELGRGDLIFTGTPAGVGPLQPGDQLRGQIEGIAGLEVVVVER